MLSIVENYSLIHIESTCMDISDKSFILKYNCGIFYILEKKNKNSVHFFLQEAAFPQRCTKIRAWVSVFNPLEKL